MDTKEKDVLLGIVRILNSQRKRIDRAQAAIAAVKVVLARSYTTSEKGAETFLESFGPLQQQFLDECTDHEGQEAIDAMLQLWQSGKDLGSSDA